MGEQGFYARLAARCLAVDSLLCVGLDPRPAQAPTAADAVRVCLEIARATEGVAAAYKPNAAFFEALGPDGWRALCELVASLPDGVPVILDAKRGDIASSAEAYARAAFDVVGADAVTVHPWLGGEALGPFIDDPDRGAFILCRTSNPGAAELQHVSPMGPHGTLYETVAEAAEAWTAGRGVGLVVGATQPEALGRVRDVAPNAWILAPGVGAQGGDAVATLEAGLRTDGLGVLVNVSRGISQADDPAAAARDYAEQLRAARAATLEARAQRTRARGAEPLSGLHARIADGLVDAGCVRFGSFTLKSGATSPIYLDLRRLVGAPSLLADVGRALGALCAPLTFDHLASLPYAAVPIGTAASLVTGIPQVYPRKEAKSYGTKARVEGVFEPGDRVVMVDDLATTGGSKVEALEKLSDVGLVCSDVVVLIERGRQARPQLAAAGLELHAVFTLELLLEHWLAEGAVTAAQAAEVRAFLAAG